MGFPKRWERLRPLVLLIPSPALCLPGVVALCFAGFTGEHP